MNKEFLRLGRYNEELYADGHYSKYHNIRIIYTEGYNTECLYAWCRYAEDPCAEGQYAEDHYAEGHNAEGHFAVCHYPEYHFPSFECSKSGNTYRRERITDTTDDLIAE